MLQIQNLFVDERLLGFCAYCGGAPETGDHVPPKVFLDKPYPENLPKVGACFRCNNDASLDEEFVACAFEAAVCNTVDASLVERAGIARTLRYKPDLASRLGSMLTPEGLRLTAGDVARIERVLGKTARALWTFETGEPTPGVRPKVSWAALSHMDPTAAEDFFAAPVEELLPEIGSRMFIRLMEDEDADAWVEVQKDRFSYAIETAGRVKMVVRGYLAVEVDLESDG